MQSSAFTEQVTARSLGIAYPAISETVLGLVRLWVPPLDEQAAIVRYLDHVDRRIRRTIRAKTRLIALLEEQKQAIIHRAVTRGLNPDVPLKPSGVEWLGDVPAHWGVRRLRYLGTKFGSGFTPRGGAAVYQASGIVFLRSQNVHFGELRLDGSVFISPEVHDAMRNTHVLPGDVLLNITGASIGRVCAVPDAMPEANVNQHVCIIRPMQEYVASDFLAAYLSISFIQSEIRVTQNGASREGFPLKSLKNLPVLLPPVTEQDAIMRALAQDTASNRSAIDAAQREIALLREYRTRLIADVVTGAVDVRAAAAALPDEPDEALEEMDDVGEPDQDEEPAMEAALAEEE